MSLHSSYLIIATLVALCSSNEIRIRRSSDNIEEICSILQFGEQNNLPINPDTYALPEQQVSGMYKLLPSTVISDEVHVEGVLVEACAPYHGGEATGPASLSLSPLGHEPRLLDVYKHDPDSDITLNVFVESLPIPKRNNGKNPETSWLSLFNTNDYY